MPQYMLLIYEDPTASPAPDSPQAQAEFGEYGAFTEDIRSNGQFVSGAPLQMTGDRHHGPRAATARRRLSDGPFAETKERLGGYYLLDCPTSTRATAQGRPTHPTAASRAPSRCARSWRCRLSTAGM